MKESKLAHKYLDGLNGIEIGASLHNPFNIKGGWCNVDYSHNHSFEHPAGKCPVNIVAYADRLPFKDNTLDYILSSHVIEHAFRPIKTIKEWLRVIKPGGYVFMIVPHKDRTFDKNKDC